MISNGRWIAFTHTPLHRKIQRFKGIKEKKLKKIRKKEIPCHTKLMNEEKKDKIE
jgi:hypothetical protein